jgi:putative ABC transport system ATP-binding protein
MIMSDNNKIIRVSNLHKRYQLGKNNFVHALRGASIEIAPGEMMSIMGPSGSGKSTMMHLMGCLDRPDDGEIWLSGRRVDNMKSKDLNEVRNREIGFIFQGFNLVPSLNAIENVALAVEYTSFFVSRKKTMEVAAAALEAVGLGDRMKHRSNELSGGQQQRVAIARALVNEPTVVLGDEPTGDLDSDSSNAIVKLMRDINQSTGTTFVLVTHNPEVGESCDRIVHMRDGMVSDS